MELSAEDAALWAAMGKATPRNSTIPTPGAKHDLKAIQLIAKTLGRPLMPWQAWAARIVSERHPDNPQRFRYRTIVLTVPRQSGKTTLMRCVLTQRAITSPNRQSFYTAQSGKDAAERWRDLVKDVAQSKLAPVVKTRLAAGSQGLHFPNGARISPFAPTEESLHGYTPHDVMLDEIFHFDAQKGNDLLGAIKPAQITLQDRQLWLVSTMGSARSEFLNEWLETGQAALADPGSQIAFIDFGMEYGLDGFDPANWDFHPALGHRITKEDLEEAAAVHTRGEFERAYLNRRTSSEETFVPMETWDALAAEQAPVPLSDVAVAYDVAYSGESTAVVGAWRDAAGLVQLRVIRSAPGSTWLPDYYAETLKEGKPRHFGADSVGETRAVSDTLKAAHSSLKLEELTPRDYATACIAFKNHILNGTLRHDGSPALRAAVAAAVTRPLGEGWAFSGAKSLAPIPELKAAVVAVKMLESKKTAPKPKFFA